MRIQRRLLAAALLAGAALPGTAAAHSFGRSYNLPVPFWMYVYGAAAALVLSFLVVGYFVTVPARGAHDGARDIGHARWVRTLGSARLVPVLRGLSVLGLLLCVLTGLFGNRDPYRNFNMTFFWVVFALGFTYFTAIAGDLYAAINPWRVLAEALERWVHGFKRGRVRYPERLASWPALGLYMAFIWIELFAHTRPFSLASILLAYSGINLLGVWVVGASAWFRHCEFLSVFLRLVARMAPLDYRPAEGPEAPARLRLRAPFAGAVQDRAESTSLLLFVLFMLSSTAFDGLSATAFWFKLFWVDPFGLLEPWVGKAPIYAYPSLRAFYLAYQTFWLLASPFVYLGVYTLFIGLAKWVTRSRRGLRELALGFAYSLLPIALVYNVTHYYTLVLTQGVKIVSLASDPFGWGWNLLGTAGLFRAPILPDMGLVWHTQVGLVLFGHIVSVYLAHVEALRLFPTRRQALLSQLPMLGLMVVFTGSGLWILAQPIQSGG